MHCDYKSLLYALVNLFNPALLRANVSLSRATNNNCYMWWGQAVTLYKAFTSGSVPWLSGFLLFKFGWFFATVQIGMDLYEDGIIHHYHTYLHHISIRKWGRLFYWLVRLALYNRDVLITSGILCNLVISPNGHSLTLVTKL